MTPRATRTARITSFLVRDFTALPPGTRWAVCPVGAFAELYTRPRSPLVAPPLNPLAGCSRGSPAATAGGLRERGRRARCRSAARGAVEVRG